MATVIERQAQSGATRHRPIQDDRRPYRTYRHRKLRVAPQSPDPCRSVDTRTRHTIWLAEATKAVNKLGMTDFRP
ncbi:hypothetical protein GW17_00022594 [Ensete ventricosum]|nr:hypothetical protein GW17_00022594 [Ensete ventricosum]